METSIDGVYELQALFQFAPVTTLPTLPYHPCILVFYDRDITHADDIKNAASL